MDNRDYYQAIFKRKSFHLFRDTKELDERDLNDLNAFIATVVPLHSEIRTKITIVREFETSCRRGAQYCILFYSETKEGYLNNIGYIGEQIDLYLAAHDIGSLWFGIGKTDAGEDEELDYVIMIAIAKMDPNRFRKDMFKSKRKPLEEIWKGDDMGVAGIVRFSPSACNTQPWFVENDGKMLKIFRYRKAGKRGIMPVDKVIFYNRIDIGIFLFILEVCLKNEGYDFIRQTYEDHGDDEEMTLAAQYSYQK